MHILSTISFLLDYDKQFSLKIRNDGSTLSTTDYEVTLQERTLFEGYCLLEYSSDDHWVTEFTFNVSNDGSRFTENFNVYTYQSLCQEYQNNTGNITFVFKVLYKYWLHERGNEKVSPWENQCRPRRSRGWHWFWRVILIKYFSANQN